nr:S46 family peptidase [Prevotella sp. AGR2160]
MKAKSILGFLLLSLCNPLSSSADEGMWTLYNLPEQTLEVMQSYGFQLNRDQLYSGPNALKNAVVNFSGYCSGVVVSPDGLVFTNHHCGFEAIRSHSTVDHDYMLNGFYAKTYADELPNENMFVSFMKNQEDVTNRVESALKTIKSSDEKEQVIDSLQNLMTDSVKRIDSTLHVNIDAFYEGNKWYATTYQDFTDLRLVFTVPKSMGKFGGETDNWMWPRQTCDFSVFRIYCDPKTGGPAAYSKDNVPYHPKRWAQVSLDGYDDGSYAMTIGYPGSTSRYLSSYGIQVRRDDENAPRAQVRGVKQEVMLRHMRADEAVRIKYDSKFAQSSNYWKNSIGMNKCIDSIGLINQKRLFEQKIQAWQDTTKADIHKVDFARLASLYSRLGKLEYVWTNFSETFTRRSNIEFNVRAMKLGNGMEVKGPENKPKKQYHEFDDNSNEWDAATDEEMLAVLLKNYRDHVDKEWLPAFYQTIDKQYGGNYQAFARDLYTKSLIMKPGAKIYFNSKDYKKDAGVNYGLDLQDVLANLQEQSSALEDSIADQEKYLCAAKIRMEQDQPHYSDANFTMRLSYGKVGGFDLGGKPSGYYTTAESIVEKMKKGDNGVIDYQAEPIMHQLLSVKDFGRYADKKSGQLQLCFLTNNDITGGNSGSPMFNGKGQLIGLAFDGNWDSLSSDINFDRHLARCIGVDIRYVVYMMDKWGHADRLIREIGCAPEATK